MASTTRRTQLWQLPIDHRYASTTEGEVHSRQSLLVPRPWLPLAFEIDLPLLQALGPFYFRRLARISRGLIQTHMIEEQVRFELRPLGWPLLCFATPEIRTEAAGGAACYPISGGVMLHPVAGKRGYLCLNVHQQGSDLRLCMEIEGYYSRISGSGKPRWLRRKLYETTQAAAHHLIARDHVRHLALALCTGGIETLEAHE